MIDFIFEFEKTTGGTEMPYRDYEISRAMRKDVLTASPEESTMAALRKMAKKRVGSIVVVNDRRPIGIFTERDLLYKVVLEGKDPDKTPVKNVMTKQIVTIGPDKSIESAYTKMSHGDFRHLIVMNNGGKIAGIISIKDLARIREQILEMEVERKTQEITDVKNKLGESLGQIQKEMTFAGNFQSQLIEKQPPSFRNLRISHVYRQATSLGGDYFGISRIDNDHAGILVVDVMGHGITSAMIAVEIKMYYDMLSKRIILPGVMMTEMNRSLSALMPPGFFVAGCYCVLNLKTLHLTYTHFGLPKPGILRAATGEYEILPPCQVPLGIKYDTVYPEKDVFLKPGDKLLFFTDGCAEQKNERGKMITDRRFIDVFKSLAPKKKGAALVRSLYNFVVEYKGDIKLNDDLLILLVECLAK